MEKIDSKPKYTIEEIQRVISKLDNEERNMFHCISYADLFEEFNDEEKFAELLNNYNRYGLFCDVMVRAYSQVKEALDNGEGMVNPKEVLEMTEEYYRLASDEDKKKMREKLGLVEESEVLVKKGCPSDVETILKLYESMPEKEKIALDSRIRWLDSKDISKQKAKNAFQELIGLGALGICVAATQDKSHE